MLTSTFPQIYTVTPGCNSVPVPIPVRDVLINPRQYKRYQIIKLHDNGVENKVIVWFTNLNISTVNDWVNRAQNDMELKDKPRTGRPPVYDEALRHRTVAFYCQTTPLPATGRWTLRWAEKYLETNPESVGACLCRSTIWRILNSQNLKPHRRKYFLQITDPDFFSKMEHILEVYNTRKKNLFCFDECTGIQVLLRIAPDVYPEMSEQEKRVWLEEFEYIRNGTIDLLAFLDVQVGKVNVECKPDHTKETFLSVFEKHLASVPRDERIDYIMDNLACHYSFEFCQLVAKFSDISCPDKKSELKLEEQRRQWLQSEDKRIVIHFTPFHGSWLNMIEIWFGILGTKCLKESYASPDELIHAICSMAEIWNTKFAHPFKSKYNGVGLHEKVVKRFIKFLYRSSEKLHIKFLTKQLLLMSNMIEQYWDKVSINQWQQLFDLLYEKEQHLWHCIDKDDKPKRKKKACAALKKLFVDLSNSLSQEDKAAA
jgi:transposase